MSASSNGGPESPSGQRTDSVGDERTFVSTGGGDSGARLGLDAVGSTDGAARVSLADADGSVETRVSSNMSESRVLKLEEEEIRRGDASGGALENQPSSSVLRGNTDDKKKADLRNGNSDKRVKSAAEDYDSILSEFDQFAAKGLGEAVGYGYEIGDMVWGKVKSHPWWPGHIYNEALASPSVRRSKREGHVLVAFFGDSSYGWFQPGELVPFEENFAEKSQQTSSRPFVKAVEEAVDELSRRRSLALACRCRNEFNFWPSSVQGNFVVDVGDYEPGVYSLTQINKARETFQPIEMLSFVQHLALTPIANQNRTIGFIKNKATVLACRKALYEEFDETYAQAFGMVPVRPPRPSAPVAVDPSKAPLSGRLVIAEALGKSKLSAKSPKTKEQLEKDKYLFKRRDEPNHIKTKKASSTQAVRAALSISLDGSGLSGMLADSGIKGHMHQTSVSGISDGQHQPTNDQASIVSDIKSFEASRKLVEGGVKKVKVHKRRAGELNAENATPIEEEKKKKKKRKKEINIERPTGELTAENVILVEKKTKKKEIRAETSTDPVQLPLANSSGVAVEKVPEMLFDVPLDANKQPGNEKDGVSGSSSLVEAQRAVDLGQVELQQLVTDLRALALNPFHGEERNCLSITLSFFLKYRSLIYQKSLVLSPPTENETSEVHSNLLPASTALHGPGDNDKSSVKLTRPSVRPDDPTKGGKKRVPPDRPEAIKKRKKLDGSEDVNKKKKLVDSEDIKKKKIINESKLSTVEKKIPQRSTELQWGDMKEITEKNVPPTLTKAGKLDSGRRMEQPARVPNPTMLVMKFPTGAGLPSGAELRAKFARFGPLDHSATRVFWKSYTCRLVFRQKVDAQAALKFAIGSSNLFGNANVRSYIREVGAEAVESEPVRVQKEDSAGVTQSRNSTLEHRTSAKVTVQPPQQSVQLKSCLKKPSAEEGGNGNGRGTRVKFILGGEGSTKTEQLSSFPEGTSSYAHSMDSVSKNLPTFVPQSTVTPLPAHQFQNFPINMPTAEPPPRSLNAPPATPTNDISQQFLSLLIRCKEVVTNLTEVLGYAPYHAL